MDELAKYLRASGGSDQDAGWAPTANDMQDAMAKLMAPDANLDALAGPPRKPLFPSLSDTIGKMGQQWNLIPDGPTAGVEPHGRTPVYDPLGSGPPDGHKFGSGQVMPPQQPPVARPFRGFR